MARDPTTPADPTPDEAQDTLVDPTRTLPSFPTPNTPPGMGQRVEPLDPQGYDYYLRDGWTPYRAPKDKTWDFDVFSKVDDAWMGAPSAEWSSMWPTDAATIAGEIGGEQRLAEPIKGFAPALPSTAGAYAPQEDEGSSTADLLTPGLPSDDMTGTVVSEASDTPTSDDEKDKPAAKLDQPLAAVQIDNEADDVEDGWAQGTEMGIRQKGLNVDLPFETPGPQKLRYSDQGPAKAWTPPEGFRLGMPPIDPDLADDLGVDRNLGAQPTQPLPPPEDEDEPQRDSGQGPNADPVGP